MASLADEDWQQGRMPFSAAGFIRFFFFFTAIYTCFGSFARKRVHLLVQPFTELVWPLQHSHLQSRSRDEGSRRPNVPECPCHDREVEFGVPASFKYLIT